MSATTYAWKVHKRENRRICYDRHLRLWTMWTVDADENQIDDADYHPLRARAFGWLKTGIWHGLNSVGQ